MLLVTVLLNSCSSTDSPPVSMGELDQLNLLNLDSTQFKFTKQDLRGSIMAVVYSPGCEHCQAQAVDFRENMDKLEDVTLIMIGSVPMQQQRDFSVKYGLKEFKNVRFAYSSPVTVLSLWEIHNIPHIVLYNKDFKPIKTFAGTTSVDKILASLKEVE